jgi:LEA14-like dessication related protein
MKKVLFIGGLGLAGFGLYRYFKYQVDKAMSYDYKIKSFKIVNVAGKDVTVAVEVEIINKSSFEVTINEYSMELFFKGIPFTKTSSKQKLVVSPNSSFTFKGQGVINLDDAKQAVIPFLSDVALQKPIDIQVTGYAKIIFLGVAYTVTFDKKTINYSMDLLKEYGVNKGWENLKTKFPQISSIFGFLN